MMKRENVVRFLDLLHSDKVNDEIKDLYIELLEGHIQDAPGTQIEIILDLDGEIDERYFVGNSTRMDVYEGNAIVVASIRYDANVTDEDMGEITEVLDNDEYEKFVEYLYGLEDVPEDEQEEYLEDNLTWDNFCKFNSLRYDELKIESWEANVDYYGYEEVGQKIFECTQQLEDLFDYLCNN